MKSLYFCKCGKSFYKNTESATTGFRLPDYGPGNECYGCPYACEIPIWDPVKKALAVKDHECRGSKLVRYDSFAALSLRDKCVGRIYSLDFEFLHQISNFANELDGIEPYRYALMNRPSDLTEGFRSQFTPRRIIKESQLRRRFLKSFFCRTAAGRTFPRTGKGKDSQRD